MRTVTIVRTYCETCGYAVSAMSVGALIDAKRDHEAYVLWTAALGPAPREPLICRILNP